jgi:hypothetical protein
VAGEPPQPARPPGPGAGGTALPGLFAKRLLTERRRTPSSRRGDDVDASSHTARLTASRGGVSPFSSPIQPSLFAVHVSDDSSASAPRGVDDARPAVHEQPTRETALKEVSTSLASGQKGKARDILAAIRTLKQIEQEHRPATADERQTLQRFGGFGAVALSLFPHALTHRYEDDGWRALGEELQHLLTPEEYESARKTVTTAYYTSPLVMRAMHAALQRLGVPADATVLEPGCGIGNFMTCAPEGMKFIGVERDGLSGRLARAIHPTQDIRIERFQETRLPEHRIDAVIGNVPFSNVTYPYHGDSYALHDYFLVKSLDALKPGGVMALVTSHYTLDKQQPKIRERIAAQADFLGAIRLPSDTFHRPLNLSQFVEDQNGLHTSQILLS